MWLNKIPMYRGCLGSFGQVIAHLDKFETQVSLQFEFLIDIKRRIAKIR